MNILLPVDLHSDNDSVFAFAAGLAREKKAKIVLLSVLQIPVLPGNAMEVATSYTDFYDSWRKDHERLMRETAKNPILASVPVVTELIEDSIKSPADTIADYCAKHKPELVVLSSKHRKGLDQVFAGSELLRIVRFVKQNMLVLSSDAPRHIRRIAFATDFSEMSAKMLRRAKALADFLGATLQCVKINTLSDYMDQREFSLQRAEFIQKSGMTDLPEILLYNAWEVQSGIVEFAEDYLADAVLLGTHGRKGLSHLFYGSLTEDIIKSTTMPVAVIHP